MSVGCPAGLHRSRGFTLLELMLGLAVLAVVVSLAAPAFTTFRQNADLAAMTNDLVAHINRARQEAISRNVNVVLCRTANINEANPDNSTCAGAANNSWTTGWLVYTTPGSTSQGHYQNIGGDLLATHGAFTNNASITSNGNGNNWLALNADGSLNEGGIARYAVCDDRGVSAGRLIEISMTGRVRVTNTTSAASTDCTPG